MTIVTNSTNMVNIHNRPFHLYCINLNGTVNQYRKGCEKNHKNYAEVGVTTATVIVLFV